MSSQVNEAGEGTPRRYLRDHDVAVRCSAPLDEAVQDVLRDLSGFTTARRSSDDHHRAFVDGRHDLFLKLFDGQLLALHQDLNDSIVKSHGTLSSTQT